jgi:predicted amino acid-binding ACT domain protein
MSELNNTPADGIPEVTFEVEVANVVQTPVDDTLSIPGMAADAKATGEAIDAAKNELQEEIDAIDTDVNSVYGKIFPVGSIYVSTSATAPTFGGTNWRWQEILLPVTYGDLMSGARDYAEVGTETPGTVHFWLRIADAEVSA